MKICLKAGLMNEMKYTEITMNKVTNRIFILEILEEVLDKSKEKVRDNELEKCIELEKELIKNELHSK